MSLVIAIFRQLSLALKTNADDDDAQSFCKEISQKIEKCIEDRILK